MEWRPAKLTEQILGYINDEILPIASLCGSIFGEKWNKEPMPRISSKYIQKTVSDDVEPAEDKALPQYLRAEKSTMPLVDQECFTVLASITEDNDIYSVPAAMVRSTCEDARMHRRFENDKYENPRHYCWTRHYKSRTYILRLDGSQVILNSYETEDVKAYMKQIADMSLGQRLRLTNSHFFVELPFGIYAKANAKNDYEIGVWCEAKGYNRNELVMECEDGNDRSFFVMLHNKGAETKFILQQKELNDCTIRMQFDSLEEARRAMYRAAQNTGCKNIPENWKQLFGMEASNGYSTYRWKIIFQTK